MIAVYGLKNCDTCRKALAFLKAEALPFRFVDVREDGVSAADIARFAKGLGWEKLLNKASTTWRGLEDSEKDGIDEKRALSLLAKHPTLIKRPVFEAGGTILCGFNDAQKAALKKLAKK